MSRKKTEEASISENSDKMGLEEKLDILDKTIKSMENDDITEKCKKAKDGASNKCTEDYVIDRDYDKLWKCEAAATKAYYKCMSQLDYIQ